MKKQGSELKQMKLMNPHCKMLDTEHYSDLVKQNNSLIVDATGVYLFCCWCVHHSLGILFSIVN